MPLMHPVAPDSKVSLAKIAPNDDFGLEKDQADDLLKELGTEFEDLTGLLFAAGSNGLLIVMQGRDTAGKDGSIKRILEHTNVQSTLVQPFKVPTSVELAHDFLWRVHPHAPAKGGISIFNRSHYEDVLVVRVHNLAPREVWEKRYAHINALEDLLADSGTIIVKFMLHISLEEQEERLLAREQDVEKSWKLSVGDWKERAFWDDYTKAYEDALERCSTERAPWYIVPANKKWARDVALLETLVATLRPYREKWLAKLAKVGDEAKIELAEFRAAAKSTS
jgi:PPK2 family polyphosphate:nucleotide phosphotransferase